MTDADLLSPQLQAVTAMSTVSALPVVPIALDGQCVLAALDVDPGEHERRAAARLGAVTSTGLLHALWLLPSGVPVATENVPPLKRQRLRAAQGFVNEHRNRFERRYSPPGVVRSVGFTAASWNRAIDRAAAFTPIFERLAITPCQPTPSRAALTIARTNGIGVLQLGPHGDTLVVPPRAAVRGVPAVYRWWIAELAYARWRQDSAQPVS